MKSDSYIRKLSKGTVLKPLPVSSTRSEIRKIQRNTKQSTISDFFGNGKKCMKNTENKESDDAESDNCIKEDRVKNDSLKEDDKKKDQDSLEENSETSIAALERVSIWIFFIFNIRVLVQVMNIFLQPVS